MTHVLKHNSQDVISLSLPLLFISCVSWINTCRITLRDSNKMASHLNVRPVCAHQIRSGDLNKKRKKKEKYLPLLRHYPRLSCNSLRSDGRQLIFAFVSVVTLKHAHKNPYRYGTYSVRPVSGYNRLLSFFLTIRRIQCQSREEPNNDS